MNADNPVPPNETKEGATAHADIAELCRTLFDERDPVKQRKYWLLLQQSAPSSKALDLALTTIMNPTAPNRGEAVRYLRLHYPDRLPALLDAFSHDPDEDLRYQLTEFVRDSDPDAAVGMKINLLKTATLEKQDVLVNEIAELGNLFHLEVLQGLSQLVSASAAPAFARAAELLAQRTRG